MAYLIFQCVCLLIGPVLLKSDQAQIRLPAHPGPVPSRYSYSWNKVSLQPAVPTENLPMKPSPELQPKQPVDRKPLVIKIHKNNEQQQQQLKPIISKPANPVARTFRHKLVHGNWSTGHCKHQSSYYTSDQTSLVDSVQTSLNQALHLLNTLSTSDRTKEQLTSASILPYLCLVHQTHILFVIQSDLYNASQRTRIRQSWATLDYFRFDSTGSSDLSPSKVDYIFLVDVVYNRSLSAHQLDLFTLEIQREQDILPLQLTAEHKRLFHGYLQASELILSRCGTRINYVAFITDDLMPNVPLLGSFAMSHLRPAISPEPMYCFIVENERPVRPKKTKQPKKVIVTQAEWSKPVYPTYCDLRSGGFLISVQSLQLWMACAHVYRPFPKLPQLFLTGILTEAAGVPMQRYWTTYGNSVPLLPSLGSSSLAGQHLFFTDTYAQPLWVWKSVFRSVLSEALR